MAREVAMAPPRANGARVASHRTLAKSASATQVNRPTPRAFGYPSEPSRRSLGLCQADSLRVSSPEASPSAAGAHRLYRDDGEPQQSAAPIVPDGFRCPLTNRVMHDPVQASDGQVYERQAILEWFAHGYQHSPVTLTDLTSLEIVPQPALKAAIVAFMAHPSAPREVVHCFLAQRLQPAESPKELSPIASPTMEQVGQEGVLVRGRSSAALWDLGPVKEEPSESTASVLDVGTVYASEAEVRHPAIQPQETRSRQERITLSESPSARTRPACAKSQAIPAELMRKSSSRPSSRSQSREGGRSPYEVQPVQARRPSPSRSTSRDCRASASAPQREASSNRVPSRSPSRGNLSPGVPPPPPQARTTRPCSSSNIAARKPTTARGTPRWPEHTAAGATGTGGAYSQSAPSTSPARICSQQRPLANATATRSAQSRGAAWRAAAVAAEAVGAARSATSGRCSPTRGSRSSTSGNDPRSKRCPSSSASTQPSVNTTGVPGSGPKIRGQTTKRDHIQQLMAPVTRRSLRGLLKPALQGARSKENAGNNITESANVSVSTSQDTDAPGTLIVAIKTPPAVDEPAETVENSPSPSLIQEQEDVESEVSDDSVTQFTKDARYDCIYPTENDPNLRTPLMHAAGEGDLVGVELELARGADVNAPDRCRCTALMYAATYGHLDIAKRLIEGNADVEAASDDGWTPLITAAYNGHNHVVSYLLRQRAKVEAADERGWTSLMHVAYNGDNTTLRSLLDARAQVNTVDADQRTAVVYAAFNGHIDNVRCLLEKEPAAPGTCDPALLFAAMNGHVEVVRLLLEAAVASEENRQAAMRSAAERGHHSVVELLGHGSTMQNLCKT